MAKKHIPYCEIGNAALLLFAGGLLVYALLSTFGHKTKVVPAEYYIQLQESMQNLEQNIMNAGDLVEPPKPRLDMMYNNVMIGEGAAFNFFGGDNNIIIGHASGIRLKHGSRNILIGSNTDVPAATTSDFINIRNKFCYSAVSGNRLKCPKKFHAK